MKKNRNFFLDNAGYWLRVVALGLVLGLGLQFVRAWTEPTTAPPGGNLGAPINTGDLGQYKEGGLMLNTGGALNGLLVSYGNVGIGTTSPRSKLEISDKHTETSTGGNTIYATQSNMILNNTAATSGKFGGGKMALISNGSTNVTGFGVASLFQYWNDNTATTSFAYGSDSEVINQGRGIINYAYGQEAAVENRNVNGHIKNAYGLTVEINRPAGIIDEGHGVHIEDIQATKGYGIYQRGADDNNYFAGNVGIGTESPGAKLDVQGGSIKATGGLIIETRASDPASTVNGQMWLIVP